MLPSMLPIGYSIREYYDTKDYTRLAISLAVVIVIIYMARFFSKIAFKKNTYKDLYNQQDID